ncbi:hypothetical protein Salat_1437800 [Sesamum alatum]|uniref:DUF4283 domain-containing protein n=1 Tax=Sesamum alatum TaxID=300844 RepID=A0AAE1YBC2_9LAMI|nr:hypothetical protein Salat_1437800 [Sesamum alatum]
MNSALKFTEEDEGGEPDIPVDVWSSNVQDRGFYLIGRLLSPKPARFDFPKGHVAISYQPHQRNGFKTIENNIYLFRFNHIIDKNRVLEGCPWTFDKNILVLNEVKDDEHPQGVDLSWCPFCIHVHDLLIRKMTQDIATYIGNIMGDMNRTSLIQVTKTMAPSSADFHNFGQN